MAPPPTAGSRAWIWLSEHGATVRGPLALVERARNGDVGLLVLTLERLLASPPEKRSGFVYQVLDREFWPPQVRAELRPTAAVTTSWDKTADLLGPNAIPLWRPRPCTAEALSSFGEDGTRSRLLELLRGDNPLGARVASLWLAQRGDESAIPPLMEQLERQLAAVVDHVRLAQPGLVSCLLAALDVLGPPNLAELLGPLRPRIKTEHLPLYFCVLARRGGDAGVALLQQETRGESHDAALAALLVLSRTKGVSLLQPLLEGRNTMAVFAVLHQCFTPASEEQVPQLRVLAKNPSVDVRLAALERLLQWNRKETVDGLEEELRRAADFPTVGRLADLAQKAGDARLAPALLATLELPCLSEAGLKHEPMSHLGPAFEVFDTPEARQLVRNNQRAVRDKVTVVARGLAQRGV